MILGLLVGIWVARYLGPGKYGIISYAGAFVGIASAISYLGLDNIITRELVKYPTARDTLLGTAFVLRGIASFFCIIVLALILGFTNDDKDTKLIVIVMSCSLLFKSFNVIDFYFQSKVLLKFTAIANIMTLLISSALKISLILLKAPLLYFVYAMVFDSIMLSILFLFFYRYNKLSFSKWHFRYKRGLYLLRDSWPLILSSMAVMIYMRIDQIMVKNMIGSDAVGQYSVAVRISELWYFIPTVISTSLLPAIINAKKQGVELYHKRLQQLFTLLVWIGISIALPMTFLSGWLINLLYGEAYEQAGGVLSIYIWSGIFVALGVASGKWYLTENLLMLAFWRTFYGMLVNIVLNLLFIPKYGMKGAAIATLGSQFLATFFFDIFNSKTRTIFSMKLKTILMRRV